MKSLSRTASGEASFSRPLSSWARAGESILRPHWPYVSSLKRSASSETRQNAFTSGPTFKSAITSAEAGTLENRQERENGVVSPQCAAFLGDAQADSDSRIISPIDVIARHSS